MPPNRSRSWFETTRWHIVLAAGGAATSDSREALALLCEQYWYPLYAYLRRVGHAASDAEDLTQGFFLRLLEKGVLQAVDPKRGRFRFFLLTALKHFATNEWDRRRAMKRGGTHPPISFELSTGEDRYRLEPHDNSTPEIVYDREWALTLLNRTVSRLRAEFRKAGKEELFNRLACYVTPGASEPSYADTAAAAGMTVGAVRVAVLRLRRRYRDLLREEIAQTVASPDEIDDEIRYLITIVAR